MITALQSFLRHRRRENYSCELRKHQSEISRLDSELGPLMRSAYCLKRMQKELNGDIDKAFEQTAKDFFITLENHLTESVKRIQAKKAAIQDRALALHFLSRQG